MASDVVLQANKEDSLLRGYICWDQKLLQLLSSKDITEINFAGNGYCNDGLLYLIKKHGEKKAFANLKKISLTGCHRITDHGIDCLGKIIRSAKHLTEINLDGCSQLTDSSLALLRTVITSNKQLQCNMRGTNIAYTSYSTMAINTQGCVNIGNRNRAESLTGHILIVPHQDLNVSVGEYLSNERIVDSKKKMHCTKLTTEQWDIAVTETTKSSIVLGRFAKTGISQVIIPFDISSDTKSVTDHIATTISQIVTKEPVWVKLSDDENRAENILHKPFIHSYDMIAMDKRVLDNGKIEFRNVIIKEEDGDILPSVWLSHDRLTRSHSYFEVVVKAGVKDEESKILTGCKFGPFKMQFDFENIWSNEGFSLHTFTEDTTIVFGIEGEWESEYVLKEDAQYFYIVDGQKTIATETEDDDFNASKGHGIYPWVILLGSSEMPFYINSLKSDERKMDEIKWIERGMFYTQCLIDSNGIMYHGVKSKEVMVFQGANDVFLSTTQTFSVRIEKLDNKKNKKLTAIKIGFRGFSTKYIIEVESNSTEGSVKRKICKLQDIT